MSIRKFFNKIRSRHLTLRAKLILSLSAIAATLLVSSVISEFASRNAETGKLSSQPTSMTPWLTLAEEQ